MFDKDNKFGFINNNSNNNELNSSDIKKYVDDNTVILPLPVHTIQETAYVIIKVVNIMDLIEGVQYSTHKDLNETRQQSYRIAYVCDDGSFKLIRSLPLKNKVVHLLKVVHSTKDNYSTLSYNNTAYKVDYTKHSTNTDVEVTETLQNYLPIANIIEYNPTKEYHPATKKYVDDRFVCTDVIENVGIISKEEMQKCNNGTSRYVSSINFKEFFADYKYAVYQGMYGDKSVRMIYDSQYNRIIAYDLDIIDTYDITLCFDFNNNYMYPFSGGASQVKSYQFTNDLVITKNAILNPSKVLTKDNTQEYTPTNDYNPTTKKYVDDKTTVKILPVDYNKNCATNVIDLEPHSIYMSPNDAKFLYLGYEKLSGDFSGFFLSGNPHGKFIYTGTKDDTKIEVILEGICYTAYFKTDTVDAHTEKTVFYLTKNNTTEFIPTNDYEPATKKYVDDNKEYINYNDKLINNKITTLHISRNPVSCSTEINKKPLCELFPELLNMTYDTVFKKSISFKVNMDNFVKEYPTVKSAYNKIGINLYDENDNFIGNSYGSCINGDGLNIVYINTTQNIRFSAYFDKALVEGSNTSMETKNGYMTIQLSIPKGNNKKEFIDKIKNLKLSIIVLKTDFLNLNNESIYTPTSDYNPATKKYVDDKISSLPQLSFNESGELVVTINGVSKTFVPKE